MLVVFTAIGLRTRIVPDIAIVLIGAILGATVLPLLVSMGLVAAEREEGSLEGLLALPVSPWGVLGVKTAVGLAVCVAPLVAAALVVCLMAGGREETTGRILRIYAGCGGLGACTLVWFLAFGVRQPTDARAALVAVVVFVVACVVVVVYNDFRHVTFLRPLWMLNPMELLSALGDRDTAGAAGRIAGLVLGQGAMAALLFVWAGRRFRRPEGGRA